MKAVFAYNSRRKFILFGAFNTEEFSTVKLLSADHRWGLFSMWVINEAYIVCDE